MSDWQSFDWQGARYTQGDLIPGNPTQVATLGKQMRDAADEIQRQVANLRGLIQGHGFDSDSGRAFQEQIGDAADNLSKIYSRYDEAAKALGTTVRAASPKSDMTWASGTEWASTLELAQVKVQDALNRGKTADSESTSAQKQIDTANAQAASNPHPAAPAGQPDPAMTRLTGQKQQADGDLQQAWSDIVTAKNLRDAEGRAVASAIRDAIDHDGLRGHHGLWDIVAEVGHIAGRSRRPAREPGWPWAWTRWAACPSAPAGCWARAPKRWPRPARPRRPSATPARCTASVPSSTTTGTFPPRSTGSAGRCSTRSTR